MVLTPQPIFVVGELSGKTHLVTGRTKLSIFMKRFEKGLFMKGWFCLDHLFIRIPQQRVFTFCERVVDGLLQRVGGIALGAVDMRDGMTNSTGNSSMSRRVFPNVELRIIKRTTEKRHDIMTSGTPAGGLDVSIALHQMVSQLLDGEQIGLVVEGTEMMGAVKPIVVGIFVASLTVGIHHQCVGRDEVTGCGPSQGGFEIFFPLFGTFHIPSSRVLMV